MELLIGGVQLIRQVVSAAGCEHCVDQLAGPYRDAWHMTTAIKLLIPNAQSRPPHRSSRLLPM